MADRPKTGPPPPKKTTSPAMYVALITAAFILLGAALNAFMMWRVTARIGVAALATAGCLWLAKTQQGLWTSVAIIWIAVALTFIY